MVGHPYGRNARIRQAFFLAAGPLMDAVLLWAGFYLIKWSFGGLGAAYAQGSGGVIAAGLFWITALSAASGLIPHTGTMAGMKLWSDGYGLLSVLWGSLKRSSDFTTIGDWQREMERRATEAQSLETSYASPQSGASLEEQRARLASRLLPTANPS
jgi:hypothetical protein